MGEIYYYYFLIPGVHKFPWKFDGSSSFFMCNLPPSRKSIGQLWKLLDLPMLSLNIYFQTFISSSSLYSVIAWFSFPVCFLGFNLYWFCYSVDLWGFILVIILLIFNNFFSYYPVLFYRYDGHPILSREWIMFLYFPTYSITNLPHAILLVFCSI